MTIAPEPKALPQTVITSYFIIYTLNFTRKISVLPEKKLCVIIKASKHFVTPGQTMKTLQAGVMMYSGGQDNCKRQTYLSSLPMTE